VLTTLPLTCKKALVTEVECRQVGAGLRNEMPQIACQPPINQWARLQCLPSRKHSHTRYLPLRQDHLQVLLILLLPLDHMLPSSAHKPGPIPSRIPTGSLQTQRRRPHVVRRKLRNGPKLPASRRYHGVTQRRKTRPVRRGQNFRHLQKR